MNIVSLSRPVVSVRIHIFRLQLDLTLLLAGGLKFLQRAACRRLTVRVRCRLIWANQVQRSRVLRSRLLNRQELVHCADRLKWMLRLLLLLLLMVELLVLRKLGVVRP